jgi:hypothetical protein
MRKLKLSCLVLTVILLSIVSCNNITDPNDISTGEKNIELTKVGGKFPGSLYTDVYNPDFDRIQDTTTIVSNDNGIITFQHSSVFDTIFVKAMDTALGVSSFPIEFKKPFIDKYLKRFGATLDTSNKSKIRITANVKVKITSEGIQEFVSSNGDLSQPHTLVKYSWEVGHVYEYTNVDGVKVKRTVTSKSTTDDYPIGFWLIKVTKVEETKEDPILEKITYFTNHKFGLVGVVIKNKNGKELKLGIIPPNL